MTIPEIITELHSYGLSKTEIGNVLNVTSQAVTMMHQGKRSGEKHRQKLMLLLEQQQTRHKALSVYETDKTVQALEQIVTKTDWEIAHADQQARITEQKETNKFLKRYKQELREAYHSLGKSFPRGYQIQLSEEELQLIVLSKARAAQVDYFRKTLPVRIQQIQQTVVDSYIFPQEQRSQYLGHGFPMMSSSEQWGILAQSPVPQSLPAPRLQAPPYHCAKCGGDVRQSGIYRTGSDGRNYHTHCFSESSHFTLS